MAGVIKRGVVLHRLVQTPTASQPLRTMLWLEDREGECPQYEMRRRIRALAAPSIHHLSPFSADPNATVEKGQRRSPFLMLAGHDFRSTRHANVHFIMRELAQRGTARCFSIGYSPLSLVKHDPRSSLWSRANLVENHNGVDCYLWRTLWHPFNLRRVSLSFLEAAAFRSYAHQAPAILRQWIAEAGTIILESGMPIMFVDLIKRLNPHATVIYLCSDALDTIGCASFLIKTLRRVSPSLDGICIPSRQLASEFPEGCRIFFVPHGMDAGSTDTSGSSPYARGTHLVTVGSMLFDPTFFEIAAATFPDLTFHIIGGGKKAEGLAIPNIRVYGEMRFKDTLPYIKHAQVGIAPYEGGKATSYLVDTSMKLMQFESYGLPAVCPHVAAGQRRGRFGYEPRKPESIAAAIHAALAYGRFQGSSPLSWAEVANRILHPQTYPDTTLDQN